jgi:hypothetical protein
VATGLADAANRHHANADELMLSSNNRADLFAYALN